MRYPRLLCVFSMFFFVGISVTVLNSANVKAGEEWTASFEAFKPTDDPKYHQGIQVVFSGVYFRNSQMQIPNPENRIIQTFTGYREKKVGLIG